MLLAYCVAVAVVVVGTLLHVYRDSAVVGGALLLAGRQAVVAGLLGSLLLLGWRPAVVVVVWPGTGHTDVVTVETGVSGALCCSEWGTLCCSEQVVLVCVLTRHRQLAPSREVPIWFPEMVITVTIGEPSIVSCCSAFHPPFRQDRR